MSAAIDESSREAASSSAGLCVTEAQALNAFLGACKDMGMDGGKMGEAMCAAIGRCDRAKQLEAALGELVRLRAAIVSMRPMLDHRRIAWKEHADYLDAVLRHNVAVSSGALADDETEDGRSPSA